MGGAQGLGWGGDVADAEGDGVEVYAAVWDLGEGLGVGFEEGDTVLGGSLGVVVVVVRCLRHAPPAFGEHVGVYVAYCDGAAGVVVDALGVLEEAQRDVAGSACDVEDALR